MSEFCRPIIYRRMKGRQNEKVFFCGCLLRCNTTYTYAHVEKPHPPNPPTILSTPITFGKKEIIRHNSKRRKAHLCLKQKKHFFAREMRKLEEKFNKQYADSTKM